MRGAGRIARIKRVAALRMRRQHELEAVEVARGISEVTRKIDATEPFRAWRNADATQSNRRSQCMRAMAANIYG